MVNWRLWTYKDVSNKLLWFSWHSGVNKSIYANSLGFLLMFAILDIRIKKWKKSSNIRIT